MDVLVIMGSDSDLKVMSSALEILEDFGVNFDVRISSAHRSLDQTLNIVNEFEKKGGQVIIAAAGMSAHLAGVIAGHTLLPVIGVPLSSSHYAGLDSLLSMIEMPPGIPVGVMGHGKAGAKNAALLALEILALKDQGLKESLFEYRRRMKASVMDKDSKLREVGWKNYEK